MIQERQYIYFDELRFVRKAKNFATFTHVIKELKTIFLSPP